MAALLFALAVIAIIAKMAGVLFLATVPYWVLIAAGLALPLMLFAAISMVAIIAAAAGR